MKPKTFVIGDIHGAFIPLQQCLERCGFRKEIDTLITLGDICDGWPYVYECVEELLTIKNRIDIIGNHDMWFRLWLLTGRHPDKWRQGGLATKDSYERNIELNALYPNYIPATHRDFFYNQLPFFKDDRNRLFVHGGINRYQTLEEQNAKTPDNFYWDRDLWNEALCVHGEDELTFIEEFSEIYIGHTATTNWTRYKKGQSTYILLPTQDKDYPPMHADIVYNLDTGAGWDGKLTVMDIDTHEYWQSDIVTEVYPDKHSRG